MNAEDILALHVALGDAEVSCGPSVLALHSRDESHHAPRLPEAVVWPRNTGHVSSALTFASHRRVPVTAWCGGTSLEGNPIPTCGGIVLDFTKMDQILDVRPHDLQADVQPGVPYKVLNQHLAPLGLFFPPDPGASALIGGMIGNNASGVRAVSYGAMRDNVLSLEVVLADGRVITAGSRAIKSSAGYDLVRLFVGSEGTLGIITRATLRLRGIAPAHLAMMATFGDVAPACEAVASIVRYGLQPAALELMDKGVVRVINGERGTSLPVGHMLFLEFHGVDPGSLATEAHLVDQLLVEHGAQSVRVGMSSDERSSLWEVRHSALDSIKRHHRGCSVLIVDTCVPVGSYAALVARAEAAVEKHGVTGYFWGHAGDGNLHLGLVYDPDSALAVAAVEQVNQDVVSAGLELGGTCSGEHGVGLGKLSFLSREHGQALEVMRSIKNALDPLGILNPGKKLPPPCPSSGR